MSRSRVYRGALALAILLAACRPASVVPAGSFAPSSREAFLAAAGRTQAVGYQLLRIRWTSDNGQGGVSGTGAVRIGPDSVRVDVVVRLGVGRATLILAGDSALAEPAELVAQWLPDRFALWAALGVIRVPDDATDVARLEDVTRVSWRVRGAGGRESIFTLRGDTLQSVVRLQDGRPVARLVLTRGADGAVVRSRVSDLVRGALFEVNVATRETSEAFPREIWQLHP